MTSSPAAGKPRLEIVRATDEHATPIAAFIREVWDPAATPESVIAARHRLAGENVAEPGVIPPTYIAIQGGKVLGYVTTLAVRLWDGRATEYPAYLIKGLMVLPEFRGGPIGYHVLKAAAAELPRSAGLAVAAPALRLFTNLGYRDFGAIRNLLRPLAAGRIAQRLDVTALGLASAESTKGRLVRLAQRTGVAGLLGGIGGLGASMAAAGMRLPALGVRSAPFDPAGSAPAVDALWHSVRAGLPSAVVRDSGYLLPRYPAAPGDPYRWVAAYVEGTLRGIAMVRQPRADGDPRLAGIRIATVADMVVSPGDRKVVLALLGEAERSARSTGADALLMSASSPLLQRILLRQLYVPFGGNVHLLFRDAGADPSPFGTGVSQWYLTRGDGLADETF